MLRKILLCSCLAGPASAQGLTAMEALTVDTCSRHEVLLAEMARGSGVNVGNSTEFMAWVEINTALHSYVAILNYFEEWSQALAYVADQCRVNPTNTIWGILSAHYREAKFIEEAERLRGEQERHRQLTEQLLESEVRVAELNSRLSVADARIAELERLIHERGTE